MTSRQRLKVGDIFQVSINTSTQKYFQFVARDITQLNSDVVRVFKDPYLCTESVDIKKIVTGDVDFYVHVFLKIGIKQELWKKVGHSDEIGHTDIMFRNTNDYGNPEIKVSRNWHVWHIGEPFQHIGALTGDYQNADIGVVMPPHNLVHRMRTGGFNFVYPSYEAAT